MYRLVVVVDVKFCERTALRKSVIGMPPLTPKENGWENAAAADRNNRQNDLMNFVTGMGIPAFPVSHAKCEGFPKIDPTYLGVAGQRFGTSGPKDASFV